MILRDSACPLNRCVVGRSQCGVAAGTHHRQPSGKHIARMQAGRRKSPMEAHSKAQLVVVDQSSSTDGEVCVDRGSKRATSHVV